MQHIVIHIIRVIDGLILNRNSYPGGPDAFFADVSQWTFVWKNHIYTAQSLVGDGVIVSTVVVRWWISLLKRTEAFPLLFGVAI